MKIFLTVTFLVYMGMTKAKIEKGEKSTSADCIINRKNGKWHRRG
jgi:hypothetical protein